MASDLIRRAELLELYEGLDGQGLKVPVEVVVQNIKDMPTVDRWIPCSERLPEKNGQYLVVADCGISEKVYRQIVKYWDGEGQKWMPNNYAPSTHFVAWMPLPEPYKDGE